MVRVGLAGLGFMGGTHAQCHAAIPNAKLVAVCDPEKDRREKFAATCEGAEPVNNAVCRRAMGADQALCEFGLGEDEYMRHKATLEKNEDGSDWQLAEADALCAEHGAHHKDS